MFYKNIILVIPVWCFGWFSQMSGTDIYNNILLDLYNLALTAIPIIWFAVFDWEQNKETFLSDPKYYAVGIHDVFFNHMAFARWFGYAVWQGILLVVLVFFTFNEGTIQDGQLTGINLDGTFVFYAIVWVVNVKVLISSYEVTFWMLFWIFLSLLMWYASYVLFSFAIPSTTLYGLIQQTFVMAQNYLVLSFFVFCYIIIDEGLQTANGAVREFLHQKREQFRRAKLAKLKNDTTLDRERTTNVKHTGFAFSQEAGNDKLVTDNLSNRLKEALAKQLFNNKQFLMQSSDLEKDAPKVLTAVPNLIKKMSNNAPEAPDQEPRGYDINASAKLDDNK